jgi:predicted ATP-grasp superfamily ATP-dependent carboligase
MSDSRLTALSIDSVRLWYLAFAGPLDPVVFLGEDPRRLAVSEEQLLAAADGTEIQVLSSHESMPRDLALAGRLRATGAVVRCQSTLATSAATDKVLVKQLLEQAGLPTPRWAPDAPPASWRARGLRKRRDGTQSQGLGWATDVGNRTDDRYWEEYLDGVEYSVVLFREDGRTITFPPVWKGATRPDLLPPWRRLRVCPVPTPDVGLVDLLVDVAKHAAAILDVWGFAEVEFIVAGATPYVIEVNPRISGTVRLVAMATGVPVFRTAVLQTIEGDPPAVAFAAELPHAGAPVVLPDVIATSRITCVGPTPKRARRLLEWYAATETIAAARWPSGWGSVD